MKDILNRKPTLLLGVATACGIQGCSKYEENPPINIKSKQARLVGDWEMKNPDKFTLIENWGYYNPFWNVEYTSVELEFEEDGDLEMDVHMRSTSGYPNPYYGYNYWESEAKLDGEWEWENKKEDLEWDIENMPKIEFKIIKLTEDELKLERDDNGVIYEFSKD